MKKPHIRFRKVPFTFHLKAYVCSRGPGHMWGWGASPKEAYLDWLSVTGGVRS